MSKPLSVSVRLEPDVKELLDKLRGDVSISQFVTSMIKNYDVKSVRDDVSDSRKSQILFLLYKYDYGIRNDIKYSYENMDKESIESWMSKDDAYGQGWCFDRLYEECRRCFGDFEFDYDCIIKWYEHGRGHSYEEELEPPKEEKPKRSAEDFFAERKQKREQKPKEFNPFSGKKNLKKHKESEQL